ncbi:MAG: hypothetical protein FJX20_23185 [Alphaproteobacteria bacterium]|nr:hypothetical protein [Alphaproteobacteria bacterium]
MLLAATVLLSSLSACVTSQGHRQSDLAWRAPTESRQLASLDSFVVEPRSSSRDHRVAAAVSPTSSTELEPGQWKVVLVSGSRAIPAHDAAVLDLGQRLRGRGVTQVAMALTGGPGDVDASRAGIRQALEGLGDQQGACLFFATGHGNVAGLRLDADRGNRTLTPGELDRLLDKHCGDRPTVAIISDCDAGVFLDSRMRQPNRILIAASAKGRNSYGAKMNERHVNFDRCLMGAIDAGASTWREAFERSLPCVREREAWLGVRPSEPQAYFGAAVADLAIPGATRLTAQMR